MMRANGVYVAPGWLPGGHAQTIFPVFVRRPQVRYRRQRIDTPDGDFIDFDWLATDRAESDAPLVVLFHGLEGNSRSHYALALMAHLASLGWRGVVPHFRGCSGEVNRLPRAYHSGDYSEVGWMLHTLRKLSPRGPLFAVGVSLGGSALLNWLGREEHRASDVVTAPLHGFSGTNDYWKRASSKPWLRAVTVPTLVVNARNDPFIPASSLPTREETSAAITLEQPRGGGHGGFPGRLAWLPLRMTAFFSSGPG